MAGYPSINAWVSEVKCNRIIQNKRKKPEKKSKKTHDFDLTLHLIEEPFNSFANRADPDQAALVRAA